MTFRSVAAIGEGKPLHRNPVPPPPRIAWLALDQLVIDESYQRSLSHKGMALIRRLVENWDWNCFKPLSVAPVGDGKYEVIDGQHTAIAAATHGAIETLPCLVLTADTVAQRSAAFVGINRDRVALTPYALFRARVAAGDEVAVAANNALERSGAVLHESIRYDVDYAPGALSCVKALELAARRVGEDKLTRALKICIEACFGPIPSAVLKTVAELVDIAGTDDELVAALGEYDPDTLNDMAHQRCRTGRSRNSVDAITAIVVGQLEARAA